jgi:hypothetical protein
MFNTYSLAKAQQARLLREAHSSQQGSNLAQKSQNRIRVGLIALRMRLQMLRTAADRAQEQHPGQRFAGAGDVKII